ncbi:MAG: spondin domain-containing protein [Gammaproteobacteria bacterium]
MYRHITLAAALVAALPLGAQAALRQVTVTVENLAAANGVTFAPLHLGFHAGTFDAFNLGEAAGDAIISVAEGGSGSAWFPAFEAADPGATLGTVLPNPAGPLLPGASGQATFVVDTALNPYFTFAAMVVPSNDFFIGNDNPLAYRLFDTAGNLQITSIDQLARNVWDAGSEVFDPAAAAFVGDNDLRADQNSVVAFNFGELAAFDGLPTAAGYVFTSGLAADDAIYRISFSTTPVPIPAALPLLIGGVGVLGACRRRLAS